MSRVKLLVAADGAKMQEYGKFLCLSDCCAVVKESRFRPSEFLAAEMAGKRVWRFVDTRKGVKTRLIVDTYGNIRG